MAGNKLDLDAMREPLERKAREVLNRATTWRKIQPPLPAEPERGLGGMRFGGPRDARGANGSLVIDFGTGSGVASRNPRYEVLLSHAKLDGAVGHLAGPEELQAKVVELAKELAEKEDEIYFESLLAAASVSPVPLRGGTDLWLRRDAILLIVNAFDGAPVTLLVSSKLHIETGAEELLARYRIAPVMCRELDRTKVLVVPKPERFGQSYVADEPGTNKPYRLLYLKDVAQGTEVHLVDSLGVGVDSVDDQRAFVIEP